MGYCRGALVRVISGEYLGFVGSVLLVDYVKDATNIIIQRTHMGATEIVSCDIDNTIKIFDDDELKYSAIDRCVCGSGIATPNSIGHSYWACANILTGRSIIDNMTRHSILEHIEPSKIQIEDRNRSTRPTKQ